MIFREQRQPLLQGMFSASQQEEIWNLPGNAPTFLQFSRSLWLHIVYTYRLFQSSRRSSQWSSCDTIWKISTEHHQQRRCLECFLRRKPSSQPYTLTAGVLWEDFRLYKLLALTCWNFRLISWLSFQSSCCQLAFHNVSNPPTGTRIAFCLSHFALFTPNGTT